MQKNPLLNRPSKYKPNPPPLRGGFYLEIALNYEEKESKNGKFPSNYKANPIDFKTRVSLCR